MRFLSTSIIRFNPAIVKRTAQMRIAAAALLYFMLLYFIIFLHFNSSASFQQDVEPESFPCTFNSNKTDTYMSPWVDFHCSSCYWTLCLDLQLVSCQLSLIVTGGLSPVIDSCPGLVNKCKLVNKWHERQQDVENYSEKEK